MSTLVRFKNLPNYAAEIEESRKIARLRQLQDIYRKCKKNIDRMVQDTRGVQYITYHIPMFNGDRPIYDVKLILNFVMSALTHDGYFVTHLGGNKILVFWKDNTKLEPFIEKKLNMKLIKFV